MDTRVKAKVNNLTAKTTTKELPVKAEYVKPVASSHEVRTNDIHR